MKLTPYHNIAVDLVIIAKHRDVVKVYTPRSTKENGFELPGKLLAFGDKIEDAVESILSDPNKVSINYFDYEIRELITLPAQTDPDRDPRGHVVSIPTLVIITAEDDVFDESWQAFSKRLNLIYDHSEIVDKAFTLMQSDVNRQVRLLHDEFTSNALYEATEYFNPTDHVKKLTNTVSKYKRHLEKLDLSLVGKGRPKQLYRWRT